MRLPQARTDSTENLHDLTNESVPPGVKSVLMLEDDLTLSEMVRIFLESHSFEVSWASSGVEGLRRVMDRDFDIILCDLVMPNVPGDMFYRAVERTKKHLCRNFIFMTGHQTDPKWNGFLSKVDSPIVEKPFALSDLLAVIQTVLTENALRDQKPG